MGIVTRAVVESSEMVAGGTKAVPFTTALLNLVKRSLTPPAGSCVIGSNDPCKKVFCSSVKADSLLNTMIAAVESEPGRPLSASSTMTTSLSSGKPTPGAVSVVLPPSGPTKTSAAKIAPSNMTDGAPQRLVIISMMRFTDTPCIRRATNTQPNKSSPNSRVGLDSGRVSGNLVKLFHARLVTQAAKGI